MLELLHQGRSLIDVAQAVGTYAREVRRVGWRFLEQGLAAALTDDPRPKPPKRLDTRQQAAIVALVCGPPPPGCARWTIRLTTVEAMRRGIVVDVGRETVRQVLAHHALKPWRETMWCVPALDAEYIARMENVLNVLARPYDRDAPVVALDERPVVLRGAARPGRPLTPGHIARVDYEYVRHGTANVYCSVEPQAGRHLTHATPNRTAPRFVAALQRIARRYRDARTIHLGMDNLNLHGPRTLHTVLGPTAGAALWARECLGADRVETVAALRQRTRAWNIRANRAKRTITWRFTSSKARRVFGYTKQSTMSRSKH